MELISLKIGVDMGETEKRNPSEMLQVYTAF